MKRKIFGIGLGKTGTSTLGEALHMLGYRHLPYDELNLVKYSEGRFDELFAIVDSYDSFEDYPWPFLYEELDRRYPDGLFILTVRRSSSVWYKSLCNHFLRGSGTARGKKLAYGFEDPRGDPAHHIRLYEQHNRRVKDYFSGRADRFAVLCWEEGSGWPALCAFLRCPIPDKPFPHALRTWPLYDKTIGRLHFAACSYLPGYRGLWQRLKRAYRRLNGRRSK